ncbi:MAG: PKD domain-containing protein, partial [Methanoregula sp.]
TEQNPDHTYTNSRWPQTYTVMLTVSNTRGSDRITKTRYITVMPAPVPPVAEFTSDKRVGFAPLTVKFIDQSSGTAPLSYAWDFDNDGIVDSTLKYPANTYSSPGTYTVNLTVTGPGGTDAEVKTGYIIVNAAPVKPTAIFTSDTQSGASPLTVQFTDQSTGRPSSWYWNFGDGSISTKQNPVHTYTTTRWPQTYTVTLTVTNANGSDRTVKTRYITVTPPPGPEAGFIASSTTGRSPLTVQFTDQSTGSPRSWYWNFGDGTTSTKQNPVHTYRSLRNSQYYTVTLTVSNERGTDRLTRTGYINIVNNPPITILLE